MSSFVYFVVRGGAGRDRQWCARAARRSKTGDPDRLVGRARARSVEAGKREGLLGRSPPAAGRGDPAAALLRLLALLAATAGATGQARHLLHQLLHLAELLDELADVGGLGAAAVGDAQAAGPVDDRGVDPLGRGHRADDGL